jgi:hypothetical protein
MAGTRSTNSDVSGTRIRDDWLKRLSKLLDAVERWAGELGWSTRKVEKRMEDAETGAYQAPALLLQQDAVRVLLEPIARTAPGAEGVVDLYLMPAYDDIASLYLVNGNWQLHYMFPGQPTVATIRDAQSKELSKETLAAVLEAMKQNAV